jgi:hypothetical protein
MKKINLLKALFILTIFLSVTPFTTTGIKAQDDAEWDETVTDVEYLFGESKKIILAEGYYTNGDVQSDYLDENPNVYATFTLYKGNSYAFIIGGANNLNGLKASFYGNNFVDNLFTDDIDPSSYKIFYITPLYNGTYYLKIQSFGEAEGDGEYMYYYGFKQNQ